MSFESGRFTPADLRGGAQLMASFDWIVIIDLMDCSASVRRLCNNVKLLGTCRHWRSLRAFRNRPTHR
jgi:hypothetical protein